MVLLSANATQRSADNRGSNKGGAYNKCLEANVELELSQWKKQEH